MTDAVIVSTARTPIGKAYKGALNNTEGATMLGHAISAALSKAKIEGAEVEDVVMGCAMQQGTGFVAGLARATAEHNVTINNLLPGTFDTDRLKSNLQALAASTKRSTEAVTEDIRSSNPSRRFGRPEELGATCAFLCSVQAGYITGQNILIDGGAYPGTF
jgi:NAD(P)-dependent dehydrogenase (short-subunit alcohol dehydrogenase family)